MSFNTEMMNIPGEGIMVAQEGVEFHVNLPGIGKFKAKGTVQLTNVRILFFANQPPMQHGHTFRSFDVPIRAITNVSFNQPIFGCNNLTGKAHPISCLGVRDEVSWTCYFMEGGTGTFVPVFLRLMDRASAEAPPPPPPAMAMQQPPPYGATYGAVPQEEVPYAYASQPGGPIPVAVPLTAYVDPSDPSKAYVTAATGGSSGGSSGQQQSSDSGLPAPSAPPGL